MVATISATVRGFLIPYAAHFRQMGWQVEAAANEATVDPGLDGNFDQLHELPLSRSILDARGIVRSIAAISRILGFGYDIVHVHTPIAAFVTRVAVRRMPAESRPATVYTAHGFHFYREGHPATNMLFRTAEKLAGRWTDRLVVINDEDYALAQKHRIVPPRNLQLMPGIGVDTWWYSRPLVPADKIAECRARLGIGPDTPLFTVLGELSARKRPFDVVSALALMKHEECHLVLLGDGPERARVETTIQILGLGGRVHVLGGAADVRPFVMAATALVLASSREGLPRSIMEALSLEVPVVTTHARGNPDLVAPDAGLVVPTGDIRAMAAAMDRMLDAPDEARAMGVRGRAKMVEHYDLGILIARHEDLYRDLLAERYASGPVGTLDDGPRASRM